MTDESNIVSPAQKISVGRIGYNTYANQTVYTLSTGVNRVLVINPNRIAWTICNRSSTDVYYLIAPDVDTTAGILIASSGGVMSMDVWEDGEVVTGSVYIYTTGVSVSIAILELIAL